MISDALVFLKNQLNTYLRSVSGRKPDESEEDKVVFVDGEKMDPISFKLGAVSVLLINIEEENTLRAADPYVRVSAEGAFQRVQPEIRINLYVLFIARFKQYEQGLTYLSLIIKYFQNHRLLDHHNAPELSDKIDHLIIELVTLPFSEQNEVWNSLRTTYYPSVLYKVKMLVFRDEDAVAITEVKEEVLRGLLRTK